LLSDVSTRIFQATIKENSIKYVVKMEADLRSKNKRN
jgi:hypothetical protein